MKSGFVAIVGRPNAGKSTLINHLLGTELSIVSMKPQTTREQVLGILTDSEYGQICFIDTPGIHRARDGGINSYMVEQARHATDSPNVIWYLVDPSSGMHHEEPVAELLSRADPAIPVFLLLNKSDLHKGFRPSWTLELEAKYPRFFHISAKRGVGVDAVLAATWDLLPEGPMYYPDPEQLSDRSTRFFVAEKIREQLFRQLGDELPYSCAIKIDQFKEDQTPIRIEATLYVERESQKGMVIGQGASKIKAIGQAARGTIEHFIGQKVFLGLKVDILHNWTRDRTKLEFLGYDLPRTKDSKK